MSDRRRRARRALAIVAAAMVVSALGAMPVSARTFAGDSADCDPTYDANARGLVDSRGQTREPDLVQVHQDLPAKAKGVAKADFSATVPVYFHVITDGATGNLTRAQITAQMAVMNKTFAGGEGGADTGFSFDLAGITRTNDPAWFKAQGGGAEHKMKQALRQGGRNALNVYSTSGGAFLGWAYLPSILDSSSQAFLDGIVFDWETVPGASTTFAGTFDQGETLVHETGHWLNLEHTFYGGCSKGDFVDDTPPEKTATSGCPLDKDTCPAPGTDPVHNYMDYSYDSCYTEFTEGQAQRMRDAWLFYRAP
jgi:Pregnancy-associated plasma protein-A